MSRPYVPWPDRRRRTPSGISAAIAAFAKAVYGLAAPLIRRMPGAIFLGGVITIGLLIWLTALTVRDASTVQSAVTNDAESNAVAWMTLEQVRTGRELTGVRTPAILIWALQSTLIRDLIGLTGVVAFASVLVIFGIWWERKVCAFIQTGSARCASAAGTAGRSRSPTRSSCWARRT